MSIDTRTRRVLISGGEWSVALKAAKPHDAPLCSGPTDTPRWQAIAKEVVAVPDMVVALRAVLRESDDPHLRHLARNALTLAGDR
jgi:hypothetical protein